MPVKTGKIPNWAVERYLAGESAASLGKVLRVAGATIINRLHHMGIKTRPRYESLEKRFWGKVDKSSFCWLWTANKSKAGYGKVKTGGKTVSAHRMSWLLSNGPIPKNRWVLHHCDVRACVNPNHLYLGTAKQNTKDSCDRGHMYRGEKHHNAKLTSFEALQIRSIPSWVSPKVIGKVFNISKTQAYDIRLGKSWKHLSMNPQR